MIVIHDPACAEFGSPERPEQPARVIKTAELLRANHPDWEWQRPGAVAEETVLLAHDAALLARLRKPEEFDADTPYFDRIADHALRSVAGALTAMDHALVGRQAFSLLRPPGHHATRSRAMGFCYLNQVAVAALEARRRGIARVAVWDFDAHHGNGTEDILAGVAGTLYVSVHQAPCYPGTGLGSEENCLNFPVAPRLPREELLEIMRRSWNALLAFHPDLVLVSAGFDAYERDPVAQLTASVADYGSLGRWVREANLPTAVILEGGYSGDLPLLVDAFLTSWDACPAAAPR
ncbi:MAG TPA: histone deacetylase [Opitutaceae bacterium]|nr:histone deacetylase [Opitutaceae bacterium]